MSLTPKQELFAQYCVELVNQQAAYRKAYDVAPDTKWTTVSSEASKLASHPDVAARIRELQDLAAAQSAIPSLVTRIQELREIETANPNDIIAIKWGNCRRCRGEGHAHQWKDEQEYALACDTAMRLKQKTLPDCAGGFGFNPYQEPVGDCPGCFGVGERVVYLGDTSKLTGPARRLYKGAKIKGNGDIEILLHDQMQARDMLNRIMGAYKDGANNLPQPAQPSAAQAAQAARTPEERSRSYLRMVSG